MPYVIKKLVGEKMKVFVNRDGCIGCGTCEALCSEVFKLLEDGKSSIVEKYRKGEPSKGKVGDKIVPCVENAKTSCPVEVISPE